MLYFCEEFHADFFGLGRLRRVWLFRGAWCVGLRRLGRDFWRRARGGGVDAVPVPKKPVMFDLSSIDKSVDPCNDFYLYACGNWKKNNPIPIRRIFTATGGASARWGSRISTCFIRIWRRRRLTPKTPLQVKYGNYYAACMNVKLADELGAKPIQPELASIAAFSRIRRSWRRSM